MEEFMRNQLQAYIKDLFARDPWAIACGIGLVLFGSVCSSVGSKLAWRGTSAGISLGWKTLSWFGVKLFKKKELGHLAQVILRAMDTYPPKFINGYPYPYYGEVYVASPHHIKIGEDWMTGRLTSREGRLIYNKAAKTIKEHERAEEAKKLIQLTELALYRKKISHVPDVLEVAEESETSPTPPWNNRCTCHGDDVCDFCSGVFEQLKHYNGLESSIEVTVSNNTESSCPSSCKRNPK